MEYLSLQDIPHRQYDPLQSRRTAPFERQVGSMAAAVSRDILFPDLFYHPPPHHFTFGARHLSSHGSPNEWDNPPLSHMSLPPPYRRARPPPVHLDYEIRRQPSRAGSFVWRQGFFEAQEAETDTFPNAIEDDLRRYSIRSIDLQRQRSTGLMRTQSQYMRNSPPLQPGETASRLPSFSEFVSRTRADTPPRTPSRRNGSADSSPHARPQFEEVTYQDRKRRRDERNDTLGDIYAHQRRPSFPAESMPTDPRRMSSVIDPALHYQNSHREAVETPAYAYHRRQSSSYPPPHVHVAAAAHNRHRSSPTPRVQSSYRQPSIHPVMPGPSSYHPAPASHPPVYEQRPSYYPEASVAPQGYGYDRPQGAYYPGPPYHGAPTHPGYDNGYSDNIRFHPHVGSMDPNAFNRKRRGNLPKEATNLMKQWFAENRESPYPTEDQKLEMCKRTGLNLSQVSNWFINARRRAPGKEARDKEAAASLHGSNHDEED